ncbi:unknown [Clostridium sp. CAG:470]|nr:unknown [Clostridium sp. CAG:470]
MCEEIIDKVKWFMERKDYNGLRLYIDEKEKSIETYTNNLNYAEEEYMDSLVNNLK